MKREEVSELVAHVHMAHVVSLMALVKSLEMSGALKREDFVHVMETSINAMHKRNNHEIAALVGDILDRFHSPEKH
jgi:hypothetical protein